MTDIRTKPLPFILIFIFSFCSASYAHWNYHSGIDSLKAEVQKTGISQPKKIQMRNDIARLYRYVNVDSSMIWANMALNEAKNAHDEYGQAWALHNIGRVYIIQDNSFMGLKNILASLKISEKILNYELIGVNLEFIALLNEDNSDIPTSIRNFEKAFAASQKAGDKRLMSWQMGNIGMLWLRAGDTAKAGNYFSRCLKYAFELGDDHEIANAYEQVGNSHSALGRDEKAFDHYRKALFHFTRVGNEMGMGGAHFYIAQKEAFLGRYADAIKNYDTALQYAELSNPGPGVVDILKGLSSVYSKLGDFKKAYEYYTRAENIEYSISKQEMAKKAVALQTRSDFEKKMLADSLNTVELQKQQEYKLQKQRIYSFSIGGIALCFIIISSLVYRNYKGQKLSNKLLSEEKDKSESLLLNILPAEVADELKIKGSADARLIDEVTVLFTDFKGFTTLSEKLSPEELVRDLNECFSAFDHIMQRHSIEKIKTIGDAYMAAGGLPTPNSTHPVDVVLAAMEIRDFIHEGKVKKIAQQLPYFEIRIGVHTGPVVAGIVGVKKFAYDIWGDTVNTASRMESSGEVGKVNISGATYELVKDKFNCTYRGKVSAKNKGEIDMYFVEA